MQDPSDVKKLRKKELIEIISVPKYEMDYFYDW